MTMPARIGPRQEEILARAARSRQGAVMPANRAERLACQRLARRGILRQAGLLNLWYAV